MANTYSQLGIHVVTAVKKRQSLIDRSWLEEIYKISGKIIFERGHYMLAIGGEPDHLHLFYSMNPRESISDLVGAWKAQVSGFISRRFKIKFEFQRGYGAFAVGRKDWPTVTRYIKNQYEHHNGLPFKDEYIRLLEENKIDYDSQYLFMWNDEGPQMNQGLGVYDATACDAI